LQFLLARILAIDKLRQRGAEGIPRERVALIQRGPEHRMGAIELPPPADTLRASPGQPERDLGAPGRLRSRHHMGAPRAAAALLRAAMPSVRAAPQTDSAPRGYAGSAAAGADAPGSRHGEGSIPP